MPEGPEVAAMARFINDFAKARIFVSIGKSSINKNPAPPRIASGSFYISAQSRGKELRIDVLKSPPYAENDVTTKKNGASKKGFERVTCDSVAVAPASARFFSILIQPGMTGCFVAQHVRDQHCHLWFGCGSTAVDQAKKQRKQQQSASDKTTLQFVDPRRFARWKILSVDSTLWSPNRGPDPVTETSAFREHLAAHVKSGKKLPLRVPICELLLDQRFFNGVGNIYRAEAMHRASVDPFELVADLLNRPGAWDRLVSEVTAVLQESISRKFTYLQELDKKGEEYKVFNNWLQVYGKGNSAKDRQGRTVWFSGGEGSEPRNAPFPAPVAGKSRKRSRSS